MATKPNEIEGYSSPAMQARRARIMEETRKLIAEQGVAGFSLRELCRRAGVAKQTLYYGFQSKEGLIAAAIMDRFEGSDRAIPYHSPPGSLERMVERMVGIGQRNLTIPNYVAAITSFYFSQSASAELWRSLHDITTLPQRAYVDAVATKRQLQPWIDREQLIDALDGQRLGVANEWVQGRIADADMIDRMVRNVLIYLVGSVRGAARRHVEAVLTAVDAMGVIAYVDRLHRPNEWHLTKEIHSDNSLG